MIIKTIKYGEVTYTVGFEEVGSDKSLIECHILEKKFMRNTSIYCYSTLKGLAPDYHRIANWTIMKYLEDLKQKEKLLNEVWD